MEKSPEISSRNSCTVYSSLLPAVVATGVLDSAAPTQVSRQAPVVFVVAVVLLVPGIVWFLALVAGADLLVVGGLADAALDLDGP